MNRRDFLKWFGVTGAAVVTGPEVQAETEMPADVEPQGVPDWYREFKMAQELGMNPMEFSGTASVQFYNSHRPTQEDLERMSLEIARIVNSRV